MNVVIGALIIAVLGPITLELMRVHYSKKKHVEHREKEVRYKHMLIDLVGFHSERMNRGEDRRFLYTLQARLAMSSDEAIKRINVFLTALGAVQQEIGEKEKNTQIMFLEMRRDFKGKTKLTPEDFLFVRAKD